MVNSVRQGITVVESDIEKRNLSADAMKLIKQQHNKLDGAFDDWNVASGDVYYIDTGEINGNVDAIIKIKLRFKNNLWPDGLIHMKESEYLSFNIQNSAVAITATFYPLEVSSFYIEVLLYWKEI